MKLSKDLTLITAIFKITSTGAGAETKTNQTLNVETKSGVTTFEIKIPGKKM